MEQPRVALPYLNAANETNLKLNYGIFDLFINSTFGRLYNKSGDIELATAYFKKTLATEKYFYPFARFVVKSNYVEFLISNGDYAAAEVQAKELLNIGDKAQNNYT